MARGLAPLKFIERTCVLCGRPYMPTGPRQKFCPDPCGPGRARAIQARRNIRRRIRVGMIQCNLGHWHKREASNGA